MAATTALVVGTVASGYMQNKGAKDAANAANKGAQRGIDAQAAANEQFQQNIQPYLQAGSGALANLNRLGRGDYSAFENSPDYLYARDEMQQGIERGAAARGSLYSGGTNVDLARHLGGLASQNLGNYRASQMGLASLAQSSAMGAGSLGQSNANAIGGLYGQIGQNNANSAINQANAWGNTLSGLAGLGGQYMGGRSSAYSPTSYNPASTSPGGAYNFGNNLDNFATNRPINGVWPNG